MRGRDDDVGLVDREALRGSDGGRVRQAHVVRDVVGGQGDPSTVAEMLDVEGSAALVDRDHLPAVVVVDPLVGAVGEPPVVASGFDVIADADRLRPDVGVHANAARLDFPGDDACGTCLGGESVGGGVIVGEHDRVASGLVCGPPAGETVTLCLRLRAAVEAAVSREAPRGRHGLRGGAGRGRGLPSGG